jgi:GNAT superfamily N-acetyltransferase
LEIKILEPGDENLLLEFLLWLTPEALTLWHFYGKQFDLAKVSEILRDFSTVKVAGIDKVEELTSLEAYGTNHVKERIVVLGHLYKFENDSCRLGIVAGVVGKGYGTIMMKKLILLAQVLKCKKIYLSTYQDNYPALALYKKFGFKIIKEFNDRPRKAYEMELIL